jgi:DNA modification methylase
MTHWQSECGRVRLYQGDCLDILPMVAAEPAARVLITDPPYSSGGFQEARKAVGSIGTTQNARIESDTMSSEGYVRLMRRVVRSCDCHAVYMFTDWRMWGFAREAAELGGHRVRSMIVWDKGSPGLGARWTPQHELILWSARVASKAGKGAHGNVITAKRTGNKLHPTEKPVELISKIIATAEPGMVVDPFMGSGTTGIAAIRQGRRFVGIELDPAHYSTALDRIRSELKSPLAFATPAAQSTLF